MSKIYVIMISTGILDGLYFESEAIARNYLKMNHITFVETKPGIFFSRYGKKYAITEIWSYAFKSKIQ